MTQKVRWSILFLLFNTLFVGLWAQFAPYSFYQYFPNLNWSWVSLDGPYNQHVLRDIGGLNLALSMLIVIALLKPTTPLLKAVALSTLTYQIPHSFYHFAHLHLLPTLLQQISQTLILSLGVVASLIILWQSQNLKGVS